jgi:hypothetical protein
MPYSSSITGCTLSGGLELTGCTKNNVGGVDKIYIATYKDTEGQVIYSSSTGEITDLGTGYTWNIFDVVKETSSWGETVTANVQNGTMSYVPTVSLVMNKLDTEKRNLIHLLSVSLVVAIVKDNNNNYIMLGRQKGLDVTGLEMGSGVANADRNGATVTFTGAEAIPSAFLDSAAVTDLGVLDQY